jgi:hypothetical protein
VNWGSIGYPTIRLLKFFSFVEKYLNKNKMEVKELLFLGNAHGHDPELASYLIAKFPFIKFKFLPPNTTSLIQPVDRQMMASFKRLYTKKALHKCFEATSLEVGLTLKEFWKT